MKLLLFGISLILSGIMCLLIEWMALLQGFAFAGSILAIFGLCFSISGLASKEK